ncbi:MAG: Uma2 family endonuclease [Chitinophagales bacterium]
MSNPKYIPHYSFEDYKVWKGDWELIDGLPIAMSPSPKKNHQYFANKLNFLFLKEFDKKQSICNCQVYYEIDWKVKNDTVVRPDLLIVCNDKDSDFIEKVPNLVVEVLSPSTHLKDRNTKFSIYEENGVSYYIMIDPDSKKIEIFQLIDNKYKEVSICSFKLTKDCFVTLDLDSIFE